MALSDPVLPHRSEAAGIRTGLLDRIRSVRNRLVASAEFQRKVARFPLTRGFARRQAEDLFRTTTGFVHSQILFACVEIDLFAVLSDGPLSIRDIAVRTDLPLHSAQRLLSAARAIGLVRASSNQLWMLDDTGAVIHGNEGIRAMIRHHAMLYRDLADPIALLRNTSQSTEIMDYWAYAGDRAGRDVSDEDAQAYSALMRSSQDLLATEVLDAYPLERHRAVLDVGGGEGAFLSAVGNRHSNLDLMLFDLPPVAARAERAIGYAGLSRRFKAFGGNFFTDTIPRGADCITLVRVLCDHDDDAALRLLTNVRHSMEPPDTLLIAEPMDGPSSGDSLAAAYFGLYFIAMRSGRCRTPAEIMALAEAAGFSSTKRVQTRTPLFASIVTAKSA